MVSRNQRGDEKVKRLNFQILTVRTGRETQEIKGSGSGGF